MGDRHPSFSTENHVAYGAAHGPCVFPMELTGAGPAKREVMGSQIKSPKLEQTTPPYFVLDVGHSAKVFADGEALWVQVIDI